jgi:hypothetical protein
MCQYANRKFVNNFDPSPFRNSQSVPFLGVPGAANRKSANFMMPVETTFKEGKQSRKQLCPKKVAKVVSSANMRICGTYLRTAQL